MADVYLKDSTLTAIANQTRRLTSTQDTYTPSEMVTALSTVETGITPTGTIPITQNGTTDVTNYATASVNVKIVLQDGIKYQGSSIFPQNIDTSNMTDMNYMFAQTSFEVFETIDTSNVTLMNNFLQNNKQITTFPLINTQNVENLKNCFDACSSLISISALNTSKCKNFGRMFYNCTALTTVPVLDTSSAYGNAFSDMFYNCTSLTDQSLDNILQMCINAGSNYSGTKTLVRLGFSSSNYSVSRIQALSHYQDFTSAGWSIGY